MDDLQVNKVRQNCKIDLKFFARNFLYIKTKNGSLTKFTFNKAQEYIHDRLEEQKRSCGKVRAIILKGRQQGCSTYVGARFYHNTIMNMGRRTFILTHEGEATNNLFSMTKRYHEYNHQLLRPSTDGDSKKELRFGKIDSEYKVGTAGNKNTGRSSTIQNFHGSEAAFWENDQDIAAGALQAVSNEDGTEIILESTANGMGNLFYKMSMDALKNLGDYILIFVPWFWQDEYFTEVDSDFIATPEELDYQEAWGLSDGQILWRRGKIKELGSDWLFKQEYPASVSEAFQTTGDDSFISSELALSARKRNVQTQHAPLVIGCDPARFGDDRTAIVFRQGRSVIDHKFYIRKDTMEIANILAMIINQNNPEMVNIDVGGLGVGVYDRLVELGYKRYCHAINFGSSPTNKQRYKNKRAEMWGLMREWLEEGDIPDDDDFQIDLIAPSYKFDANQSLLLEKKEDMKKRGIKSPDLADALALTFAIPFRARDNNFQKNSPQQYAQFDSIL